MRVYEVPKGESGIRHGLVMMAVEGVEDVVQGVAQGLEASGFPSTACSDYGDKMGEVIEYFMVNRSEVSEFKAIFRHLKQTF